MQCDSTGNSNFRPKVFFKILATKTPRHEENRASCPFPVPRRKREVAKVGSWEVERKWLTRIINTKPVTCLYRVQEFPFPYQGFVG